jgi:UDP-2-acetamido-3-amino-2,3-dideoxy-glucuronate N-acetyltransferase
MWRFGTPNAVIREMEHEGYFVHESSYVDQSCSIGPGTKVWHFSHVMKNSLIGANCNIGQNVVISPDVVIGNNVKIQNNVSVYTGCILEDDVFCGPSMVFTNVVNPRSHVVRKNEYKTTLVRRGASLGANCTVVCGTTIGQYAFVGAGAVVTRDIPDYALVYGNPARLHGWMCACGIAIVFSENNGEARAKCKACGAEYAKSGQRVAPVMAKAFSGIE